MEKNIFKGAKFGDKFVTRDNTIVIYQTCINGYHFVFSPIASWSVDSDGYIDTEHIKCIEDIVSCYQEPIMSKGIDEDKLDELAERTVLDNHLVPYDDCVEECKDCFKAGYRSAFNNKAMEE